jgi:Calcineurin-like phosphoesterase.
MIKKLWRGLVRADAPAAAADMPAADSLAVPSRSPVHAVGDVHGQIRQLRRTIDWISLRAREQAEQGLSPIAVFLGDYIDRGDDSRAVLETLVALDHAVPSVEWVFLAGNHEAALLAFLDNPADHGQWLDFGGVETLLSYGVPPPLATDDVRALRRARDQLARAMPAGHVAFLRRLRLSFQCGSYVFVHAGLRPGRPADRQSPEDMLWIREDFLDHPQWHGRCVVHGHTIEAQPALHSWRIGIDTGAYAGGPLSCLSLTGNRREVTGFFGSE